MQFSPHTGLLWQFIWPLKNRGDFWRSFFFGGKTNVSENTTLVMAIATKFYRIHL
jgi:hypothetical protein